MGYLLTINHDIFHLILSQLETCDKLALTLTCTSLSQRTLPFLASHVHLHRDSRQLLKFCRAVTQGTLLRPESILQLHLAPSVLKPAGNPHVGYCLASALASAIFQIPKLRSLSICASIDLLCTYDPQLASAILSRQRLTKITLGDIGPYTAELFQSFHDMVHIDFAVENGINASGRAYINNILRRSQTTLTSLRLPGFHFDFDLLDGISAWPLVHSLDISYAIGNLSLLQIAFPSIRRLSSRLFHNRESTDLPPLDPTTWKDLEAVEASWDLLNRISQRRELTEIDLIGNRWGQSVSESGISISTQTRFLRSVCNPGIWRLGFEIHSHVPISFFDELVLSVPRVEVLTVMVVDDQAEVSTEYITKLLDTLSSLPLRYLSVGVRAPWQPANPKVSEQRIFRRAWRVLPKLGVIRIEVGGNPKWWRIDRRGDWGFARRAMMLTQDEGQRIQSQFENQTFRRF